MIGELRRGGQESSTSASITFVGQLCELSFTCYDDRLVLDFRASDMSWVEWIHCGCPTPTDNLGKLYGGRATPLSIIIVRVRGPMPERQLIPETECRVGARAKI
jgi:hypothetical protein